MSTVLLPFRALQYCCSICCCCVRVGVHHEHCTANFHCIAVSCCSICLDAKVLPNICPIHAVHQARSPRIPASLLSSVKQALSASGSSAEVADCLAAGIRYQDFQDYSFFVVSWWDPLFFASIPASWCLKSQSAPLWWK